MAHILTITMNPAIDVSTSVDRVTPTQKLRCTTARRDPGGGGINVARVACRLGAEATALYPVSGSVGQLLRRLVDKDNVSIPVPEETREDFTALETATGDQFRFVLSGTRLTDAEWLSCIEAIASFGPRPDFIVVSGSLPPGVPEDFYARIAEIARRWAVPVALDTSAPPLKAAVHHGVDLLKPNLRELRELTGEPLIDEASWIATCARLVTTRKAQAVAPTLGHRGALLITRDGAWRAEPLPVNPVSTVGAGDSFLGAMVWSPGIRPSRDRGASVWRGRRLGGPARPGNGTLPGLGRASPYRSSGHRARGPGGIAETHTETGLSRPRWLPLKRWGHHRF